MVEQSLQVTFSNHENIALTAFTLAVERCDDKLATFPSAEVTKLTVQVDNGFEVKAEVRK